MNRKERADYLAQEYLFLQKTVEEFDGRALTIKAWSVTFSAAGLGFAYQQHEPRLLLVAAGSALVFWIVEATWKYYQRAFYPRIFEIEEWFVSDAGSADAPFQITTRWRNEFARWTDSWIYTSGWKAFGIPFFMGVMMPHVMVIAAGLLLFHYAPPEAAANSADAKFTLAAAR
jgi:hypothetical protein